MNPADIAIIVVAQNISPQIIKRFENSIKYSHPQHSYQIVIGKSDENIFYKTRILNELLRKCFDYFKVIIQTDIDLIIPPNIIDRTFEMVYQHDQQAYHHVLRYVDFPNDIRKYSQYPFKEWIEVHPRFCSGCWNGLTPTGWKMSRGYNEDMSAWGNEDTEFYHRSMRLGIKWLKEDRFPLVHINHPPRQVDNSAKNIEIGNLYSDETDWLMRNIIKK